MDEVITVLKAKTIYKTEKWWQAIILGESFGRRSLSVYLWQRKGDRWRRVHKLKLNRREDWARIRDAIDELVKEL